MGTWMCVCMQVARPSPAIGCLATQCMASRKASTGLCNVEGLAAPAARVVLVLSPDCQYWHQLRTSSPCPPWNESRGPSHSSWKGAAAQCLHTPMRGEGVQGLNYVPLGKGFCSEGQAGQMCKFCASRGRQRGLRAWLMALKSVSEPLGIPVGSQSGQSGTSLTFH